MQIITDSAADLTAQEAASWGIQVVPLYIQFPEGEVSSADISADDFYARLQAMVPKTPTTSQPSVGTFLDIFQQAAQAGEEVLSIHISSGLSGTFSTAQMALKQSPQPNITLVDTLTLSCGQRFQVLAAAMAARAGWKTPQIIERLDAIRAATQAVFTLETLDYLARGGRIGRVQALAGSLLQIKPVITVEKADGKYSTLGRGRTISQAINTIRDHMGSVYGSDKPVWATVIHGQYAEKAEIMASALRSRLNVARLEVIRISPVLGVHTGPGVVGAGIVPMELMEDLLPRE